jgi:type II secretory pathway pseudopilin PulG
MRRSRGRLKRRLSSGYTLIEMMMVMFLNTIIFGFLVQVLVTMLQTTNVIVASGTLDSQARSSLDMMQRDIQTSDEIQQSYVAQSGVTYTSNTSTTLVLQAPSYNSAYTVISGTYDYFVYHLVSSSSSTGPYTLNRFVDVAIGSARVSSPDHVVAENVQSLALTYLVADPLTGTGSSTITLNGTSWGTGSGLVQSVIENGSALTIGTSQQVAFSTASPNTLTFQTAPVSGATVDAVFSANPALSANQTLISEVVEGVTVGESGAAYGPANGQTVTTASTTVMRNYI